MTHFFRGMWDVFVDTFEVIYDLVRLIHPTDMLLVLYVAIVMTGVFLS